jgi:gliding motility-associated-like protein
VLKQFGINHKTKANPMKVLKLVKTSCIMVLITLVSIQTNAQVPTANFTSNNVAGCAPLLVNFIDQSSNNPTNWQWTLGNGTNSISQNPSVVYFDPGTYTVKLVARNANGKDSLTRVAFITVYAKPTVDFSGSNLTGCAQRLTTTFTDLSIPGSGTISSRQWDFGDGTFSNFQSPTHSYNSIGNFNVSLMVTNSFGCQNSLTRSAYITAVGKPAANFTTPVTSSCGAPFTANFQNTTTGSGTISFLWSFGDGTTSTDLNPTKTYNAAGTYTVRLIATNETGCKDTLTKTNYIRVGSVRTNFTIPASICVNSTLNITNNTTPVTALSSWAFGDGTASTVFSPSKIYAEPGTYTIKLVNDFGACRDSITKNILVKNVPVAEFSANPLSTCDTILNVQFQNQSTNANSFVWSFGDSSTSTIRTPLHTYTSHLDRFFSVSLSVTAANGCKASTTKNNYISIKRPSVSITNFPAAGCAPLTFSPVPVIDSIFTVASYHWNFGDGETSTEQNPNHTYNTRGKYSVTLIIVTSNGCVDTVKYNNIIKVGYEPHPDFTASANSTCASTAIVFTDLTPVEDSVNQWIWNFGDGTFSTLQNPTHLFVDTTTEEDWFDIKLTVFDNGCKASVIFENYIQVFAPIAKSHVASYCNDRLKWAFFNKSKGATSILWDFGDGETSTENNPVHYYPQTGVYIATITAYNSNTGCSDIFKRTLYVIDQVADFTANETTICKTEGVTFTATGITPAYFTSFGWNFGDGVTGSGISLTKNYFNSGIYNVKLTTKNRNGCIDVITKTQYITVNGPKSAFDTTLRNACIGSNILFADNSTSDGRNPITQWIWNFGDGTIDTLNTSGSTSHTYATADSFTVSLKTTDAYGCSDVISANNMINISTPKANFNTLDTIGCPNSTITFTNTSLGSYITFLWNYGDGTTSTELHPTHSYATNGNYTVKLTATNNFGCSDTKEMNSLIDIVTPVAAFTASDYVGNCPPLIVNFTNQSSNYLSQTWNFGDNTSTLTDNPSHFYSISGSYDVVLTVKGPGGCSASSAPATITVHGPRGSFSYDKTSICPNVAVNFTANAVNTSSLVWDFNDGNTHSGTDTLYSHTYTTVGNYLPKLLLKDNAGCVVPLTGQDTIRVHQFNSSISYNNSPICDSGNVQFNSTSLTDIPAIYSWNFGDGTTSTEVNPTHFYNTPGVYTPLLTLTSTLGCTSISSNSNTVSIVASPNGAIQQSANGCEGLTVTFNGSNSGTDNNVNWLWSFGNGNTFTGINPAAQQYPQAGTYNISAALRNQAGCTRTLQSLVEVYPMPTTDAGNDTYVCEGLGRQLQATGADTYTWTPAAGLSCNNCSNPIANPAARTTYFVTGTTSHGCSTTDSVTLDLVHPFQMSVSTNDMLCVGSSKNIAAYGAYEYSWTPTTGLSNANIANPTATPTSTTTYRVTGTDEKHCFTQTKEVTLVVHNIPTVELGEDKSINGGQSIELTPVVSADVIDAKWTPSGALYRNDNFGLTIKPEKTTKYRIKVYNAGGCSSTDDLTVNVLCNGANMFIPNTFSPNNDGMNDVFYPRGKGIFAIKRMKIFSRWGEVIFEKNDFNANDASKGWDGTYNGKALSPDVFVYTVDVVCDNNTVLNFKGNIALIK